MFGRRRAYELKEGVIRIHFSEGEGWITPLTDEIIRISAPSETGQEHSYAIEENKAAGISFTVKEKTDYLEIMTKRLENGYLLYMQKLMATGYNSIGSQVSCAM